MHDFGVGRFNYPKRSFDPYSNFLPGLHVSMVLLKDLILRTMPTKFVQNWPSIVKGDFENVKH